MSFGPSGSYIALEGARLPPALAHQGPPIHWAGGFLQAAVLLARERPSGILFDPSIGWHLTFARTLPKEGRPPLVAVGETAPPEGLADEWLRPAEDPAQALTRLPSRSATLRARARPRTAA